MAAIIATSLAPEPLTPLTQPSRVEESWSGSTPMRGTSEVPGLSDASCAASGCRGMTALMLYLSPLESCRTSAAVPLVSL